MMDYGAIYSKLHENPKAFTSATIKKHVDKIAAMVEATKPTSILDFGSGKGIQYLRNRVHESWGGLLPYCYDPGVRALSVKPQRTFDGVICTDVMEHIDEPDVPETLDEVLAFLCPTAMKTFAFFSIACIPSRKERLPDGRNLHLTIRPPEWWQRQIEAAVERRRPEMVGIIFWGAAYDTRGIE